jgi:hypothetical protein
MGFAGSFDTVEELEKKLQFYGYIPLDTQLATHYNTMRGRHGTTWNIQPFVQLGLFREINRVDVVSKNHLLDWTIVQIDPSTNQRIGFEEAQRGLDTLRDKKLLELAGWYLSSEGIRDIERVYSR